MSQTFYNWQSPITGNVIVEAWGAGGGGRVGEGGGGGGAAYARSTVPVVNLMNYGIAIADPGVQNNNGDVTYFSNLAIPAAVGGGAGSFASGGAGGSAGASVGDVKFSGGAGAFPGTSGGGGGSADDASNGNGAIGIVGGIALPRGGGGGNGQNGGGTGGVGGNPGGGGGGGTDAGGPGGMGGLIIWPDNGVWPPPVNTIPYASFGSPPAPPVNQKARKSAFMM